MASIWARALPQVVVAATLLGACEVAEAAPVWVQNFRGATVSASGTSPNHPGGHNLLIGAPTLPYTAPEFYMMFNGDYRAQLGGGSDTLLSFAGFLIDPLSGITNGYQFSASFSLSTVTDANPNPAVFDDFSDPLVFRENIVGSGTAGPLEAGLSNADFGVPFDPAHSHTSDKFAFRWAPGFSINTQAEIFVDGAWRAPVDTYNYLLDLVINADSEVPGEFEFHYARYLSYYDVNPNATSGSGGFPYALTDDGTTPVPEPGSLALAAGVVFVGSIRTRIVRRAAR